MRINLQVFLNFLYTPDSQETVLFLYLYFYSNSFCKIYLRNAIGWRPELLGNQTIHKYKQLECYTVVLCFSYSLLVFFFRYIFCGDFCGLLPLEQTTKCDIHYCGTEVQDSNAQRLYSAHRFRRGRRRVIRSSFLLFPNGKTGALFALSRSALVCMGKLEREYFWGQSVERRSKRRHEWMGLVYVCACVCVGRLLVVGVSAIVVVLIVVVAPASWRLRERMTRVLKEKSHLATQWHHPNPFCTLFAKRVSLAYNPFWFIDMLNWFLIRNFI